MSMRMSQTVMVDIVQQNYPSQINRLEISSLKKISKNRCPPKRNEKTKNRPKPRENKSQNQQLHVCKCPKNPNIGLDIAKTRKVTKYFKTKIVRFPHGFNCWDKRKGLCVVNQACLNVPGTIFVNMEHWEGKRLKKIF